jgi:methylated-DNA-[protein]-cysteine S-methyltransferase
MRFQAREGLTEGRTMMTEISGAAKHTVLATALGDLTVVRDAGCLVGLYFPHHWYGPGPATFGPRTGTGFEDVALQLQEYLVGWRTVFDLPYVARGSAFQRRVWDQVTQVPYGQTATYAELAERLGDAVTSQDVGGAIGRNPLCLLIPCHRIIGTAGKLTGYAGGLRRKRALLDLEQANYHAAQSRSGYHSVPAISAPRHPGA